MIFNKVMKLFYTKSIDTDMNNSKPYNQVKSDIQKSEIRQKLTFKFQYPANFEIVAHTPLI